MKNSTINLQEVVTLLSEAIVRQKDEVARLNNRALAAEQNLDKLSKAIANLMYVVGSLQGRLSLLERKDGPNNYAEQD